MNIDKFIILTNLILHNRIISLINLKKPFSDLTLVSCELEIN